MGSPRRRTALPPLAVLALLGAAILLGACTRTVGPRAEFTATPAFDYPPLVVALDASPSSSPNGAIVTYAWELGDGTTASGVTVTHSYAEKGVYNITLTVTDTTGSTGVRTRSVEALNRVPSARFTVDKMWVGANDPLTFDASDSEDPDGEIVQYLWDFGDGTMGDGMIVTHSYVRSGWQPRVTLTVVDDDGGSNSSSRQVNVVGCPSCG